MREPSAPAKVPAPQGDPGEMEVKPGSVRLVPKTKKKRTTVDLVQVGQEREGNLVPEWDEEDAVVGQSRKGSVDGHFLAPTKATGGNEDTGVLSAESTLGPEPTSGIPESLTNS